MVAGRLGAESLPSDRVDHQLNGRVVDDREGCGACRVDNGEEILDRYFVNEDVVRDVVNVV